MVRLLKILGAITLWILLTMSCVYATEISKMKNGREYIYEYTDLNGNKGTSKHCFVRDGVNVCKTKKGTIRVIETQKKDI